MPLANILDPSFGRESELTKIDPLLSSIMYPDKSPNFKEPFTSPRTIILSSTCSSDFTSDMAFVQPDKNNNKKILKTKNNILYFIIKAKVLKFK